METLRRIGFYSMGCLWKTYGAYSVLVRGIRLGLWNPILDPPSHCQFHAVSL